MKKTSFNELKTFSIITLGCKVNTYESNIIKNDLLSLGLIEVPFNTNSDLAIINTCSVTNTADAKSRNMIRRIKNNFPDAIILVCGCYSQVNSEEIKQDFGIDILLGNKYKNNIVEVLNSFFKSNKQLVKIDNLLLEKEFENNKIEIYKDKTRAFVKIQDGCNFMCSYCIIPFTRGRQRSKDFNSLINEIQTLIANGYKEIVLTGVNTAGYISGDKDFYTLLTTINEIPGDFRVRISSIEPFQISNKIIELICHNPNRFAQHWHICLQSGSDSILAKMNRKYTTTDFLNLVNNIYKINPNSAITTDYICGFPGETDEDHEKSILFLKEVGFAKIHVFPYSKRSFTPAAKLKQVPDKIKSSRVHDILELSNNLEKKFVKKFLNKKVDVLFEKHENNINIGHASEYFMVYLKSDIDYTNTIQSVQIVEIFLEKCFSKIFS